MARKLNAQLSGSVQNPSWSPDANWVLVTLFTGGRYNKEPATIYAVDPLDGSRLSHVTRDLPGLTNVSQPGACWNAYTNRIIFSTTKFGDDWPASINPNGSDFKLLFTRPGFAGYEPTWHPGGQSFAFEQHQAGQEANGSIVVRNGGGFTTISQGDSRQPCWSPDGASIAYQRKNGAAWDLWIHDMLAGESYQVTKGIDATDVTWHPSGERLLFAGEGGLWECAASAGAEPYVIIPTTGYLGAPSWSPNGACIAAEAYGKAEPEGGPGTWVEIFTEADMVKPQI